MHIFHDWSKWEQYKVKGIQYPGRLAPENMQGKPIPYSEFRQKRVCKKCNKMQDELVRRLENLFKFQELFNEGDEWYIRYLFKRVNA